MAWAVALVVCRAKSVVLLKNSQMYIALNEKELTSGFSAARLKCQLSVKFTDVNELDFRIWRKQEYSLKSQITDAMQVNHIEREPTFHN